MRQDAGNIDSAFGFGAFAGTPTTLGDFVSLLVPLTFSVIGIMVAFYFIIAAFELITSQGDKAHIVSARSKIYHSLIGLIILILLFLALQYIIPILIGRPNDSLIF